MTYKVVDTTEWPAARLDPYWPEIFAAMTKLKARFPDDASISVFLSCWAWERAGRGRKLWLVLDESDRFIAFAMTEVSEMVATGRKVVTLKDLAGDGVMNAANELCGALEAYAKSIGAHIWQIEGRMGWQRVAKAHGYEPHSVILRKRIDANGV